MAARVSASLRRLVLHFDVNETIMIGDPVANIDFKASLNNVLAKVAIIRRTDSASGFAWHDGSPLNPAERSSTASIPPLLFDFVLPDGCQRYFERFRGVAGRFTEPGQPGCIYRPIFEDMLESLTWRHPPSALSCDGHHFLLPSFFRTLLRLTEQGRDFTVVIRTFGTDLPHVAAALSDFAAGNHPDFAPASDHMRDALQHLRLEPRDAQWLLFRQDRSSPDSPVALAQLDAPLGPDGLGSDLGNSPKVSSREESSIEEFLLNHRVIGIRDDYWFWKLHGYRPQCGKPLWISSDDTPVHHIFFDDNIHNKANDSIVAVRNRAEDGSFGSVSGQAICDLHGVFLVKAEPVQAVTNVDYFLEKIATCETNLNRMIDEHQLESILSRQ